MSLVVFTLNGEFTCSIPGIYIFKKLSTSIHRNRRNHHSHKKTPQLL